MKKQSTVTEVECNHMFLPCGDGRVVMVIESSPDLDDKKSPAIHRIYQSQAYYVPIDDGIVIGYGNGGRCAMLVKIAPHSLVVVTEKLSRGRGLRWKYYQIGENYEVQPLECKEKVTYDRLYNIIWTLPDHIAESMKLSNNDLFYVFSNPNPEWLRIIVKYQLERWQVDNPGCYTRFALDYPDKAILNTCIEAAPYSMLARWKHRMSEDQLQRCILLSPEGAVEYAVDDIPENMRNAYLYDNAKIALTYSLDKLSGHDLTVCSEAEPQLAYENLINIKAELQAYVLATVYQYLWPVTLVPPPTQAKTDVLESLRNYPAVWITLHNGSFVQVLHGLNRHACIRPCWEDIKRLNSHSDPAVRNAFHEYVATEI